MVEVAVWSKLAESIRLKAPTRWLSLDSQKTEQNNAGSLHGSEIIHQDTESKRLTGLSGRTKGFMKLGGGGGGETLTPR